ncbi:MAG: prepilin peptidase [Moorellales bacterium]
MALLIGFLVGCAVLAYTDARYGMVYNRVTLPLAAWALLHAALEGRLASAAIGAALAGGLLLAAALIGGAGGGDFKMAAALGLWFGYPRVAGVLLLACLAGCAWGVVRLARAGLLAERIRGLFSALYLLLFWGVWTGRRLGPAEEEPGEGVPADAVPFGACLAFAACAAALVEVPPPAAVGCAAAAVGAALACWEADRRAGVWMPKAAGYSAGKGGD